jgi:hypothetical protein
MTLTIVQTNIVATGFNLWKKRQKRSRTVGSAHMHKALKLFQWVINAGNLYQNMDRADGTLFCDC